MTRPRVILAMPAAEHMYTTFVVGLLGLQANTKTADLAYSIANGSVIHTLRNALVGRALEDDASHLLFLDTDIVTPPDLVDRMLSHGKDIVAATYRQRRPPHDLLGVEEEGNTPGSELRLMKRVPAGCLLVKTDVFRKFDRPWFEFDFRGSVEISEDYVFCEKARAAGYQIWCDVPLSLSIAHLALTGIYTSREYK